MEVVQSGRQKVNLRKIQQWSEHEGHLAQFEEVQSRVRDLR